MLRSGCYVGRVGGGSSQALDWHVLAQGANLRRFLRPLGVRGGGFPPLNNQGAFNVVPLFGAVVLDTPLPIGSQHVEANAVGRQIDYIEQLAFQVGELGWIDFALKDGVLHALAEILADFRDAAQALLADPINGADIIGDQDIHGAACGCWG